MRVLVVEDDRMLAGMLVMALSREGFTVDHVASAEMAGPALQHEPFDMAIVDLGLPRADGLDLIRSLRQRGNTLPILILTARDALADRVKGLDAGADDYMVKPCELVELAARMRALLRRSKALASAEVSLRGLRLNLGQHTAELDGHALELTPREWALLEALVMSAPNVLGKKELAQTLSGWERELTPNAIEVIVSRLRAKLEPGGIEIHTVRGIGYRIHEAAH